MLRKALENNVGLSLSKAIQSLKAGFDRLSKKESCGQPDTSLLFCLTSVVNC